MKPAKKNAPAKLTMAGGMALIRKVCRGQQLTTAEKPRLQVWLKELSTTKFASVIKSLDTHGYLQSFLKQLNHTQASSSKTKQVQIPVLCYRFWNAADEVNRDLGRANAIYRQFHDIHILKASHHVISKADTRAVLGHSVDDNFKLDRTTSGSKPNRKFTHGDMKKVVKTFVPTTAIAGLWAKKVVKPNGNLAGTSTRAGSFGASYHKLAAVATSSSGVDTFAHELGHILMNEGHGSGLMTRGSSRNKNRISADLLSIAQVAKIKTSALGWVREAKTATTESK